MAFRSATLPQPISVFEATALFALIQRLKPLRNDLESTPKVNAYKIMIYYTFHTQIGVPLATTYLLLLLLLLFVTYLDPSSEFHSAQGMHFVLISNAYFHLCKFKRWSSLHESWPWCTPRIVPTITRVLCQSFILCFSRVCVCVCASALINFIPIVAYKIDVILVVDGPSRPIYHLLNHIFKCQQKKQKKIKYIYTL